MILPLQLRPAAERDPGRGLVLGGDNQAEVGARLHHAPDRERGQPADGDDQVRLLLEAGDLPPECLDGILDLQREDVLLQEGAGGLPPRWLEHPDDPDPEVSGPDQNRAGSDRASGLPDVGGEEGRSKAPGHLPEMLHSEGQFSRIDGGGVVPHQIKGLKIKALFLPGEIVETPLLFGS